MTDAANHDQIMQMLRAIDAEYVQLDQRRAVLDAQWNTLMSELGRIKAAEMGVELRMGHITSSMVPGNTHGVYACLLVPQNTPPIERVVETVSRPGCDVAIGWLSGTATTATKDIILAHGATPELAYLQYAIKAHEGKLGDSLNV